jgi:hypothetical protein
MEELSAQELKAHPVPGHYRWKYGEGVTYHCGLACVYRKGETWLCDTL